MDHSWRPKQHGWWYWGFTSFETLDRQLPFHKEHCRNASRRRMWHTNVKFNTAYSSLSPFIISLFSLYALMNKHRLKNDAVKWNSAPKGTDTDLSIVTQTCLSSRVVTGIEGTCWSPSIWCTKPLHPYMPQKNVVDPWPAPYQNSNDYWCSAYTQKTSGSNFLQTSVIFSVWTQRYTKQPS